MYTKLNFSYEVKVLDELETKVEPSVHELRVGWSTDDTDMQLGEAPCSFAYSGSAKKGRGCNFEDYGETFKKVRMNIQERYSE